jgi:hypothetical protein
MKWPFSLGSALMVLALSGCGGGSGGGGIGPAAGSISGSVTSLVTGVPMSQVKISLTGAASSTDANGAYSFTALAPGNYTVTATLTGATLNPSSLSVTITDGAAGGQDFVANGGADIASQIQFLPPVFLSSDQLRASVVPAGDGVLFTDSSDFPLKSVSLTTGTGSNGPLTLPVTLASDPTLAAEGLAIVPGGLYVTSTQSGDILWLF